jgi:hypothetical protein
MLVSMGASCAVWTRLSLVIALIYWLARHCDVHTSDFLAHLLSPYRSHRAACTAANFRTVVLAVVYLRPSGCGRVDSEQNCRSIDAAENFRRLKEDPLSCLLPAWRTRPRMTELSGRDGRRRAALR